MHSTTPMGGVCWVSLFLLQLFSTFFIFLPSRFVVERLHDQVFDERLVLFHGHEAVPELTRVYTAQTQRAKHINYRHLIGARVRKPQAFRYSYVRPELLPSLDYQYNLKYLDATLSAEKACRYIVRILFLAAQDQNEGPLGRYIVSAIARGELPSELLCNQRFGVATPVPIVTEKQHDLNDYDQLLVRVTPVSSEVHCHV